MHFIQEEHRETFVEIYAANHGQRLVTTIEILSPSNKRPGTEGWELYQRKRQTLLLGNVNLVEIDLLRGGQRDAHARPLARQSLHAANRPGGEPALPGLARPLSSYVARYSRASGEAGL